MNPIDMSKTRSGGGSRTMASHLKRPCRKLPIWYRGQGGQVAHLHRAVAAEPKPSSQPLPDGHGVPWSRGGYICTSHYICHQEYTCNFMSGTCSHVALLTIEHPCGWGHAGQKLAKSPQAQSKWLPVKRLFQGACDSQHVNTLNGQNL